MMTSIDNPFVTEYDSFDYEELQERNEELEKRETEYLKALALYSTETFYLRRALQEIGQFKLEQEIPKTITLLKEKEGTVLTNYEQLEQSYYNLERWADEAEQELETLRKENEKLKAELRRSNVR